MKLNILSLLVIFHLYSTIGFTQCPSPQGSFRNNGTGGTCLTTGVTVPAGLVHTGRFTYQQNGGFSNSQFVDSVLLNGQKYQAGQSLFNNLGTIWFGGYNASSNDLCFYGTSNTDNAVPAGNWTIYFRDVTNSNVLTACSYAITSSGASSSFAPGSIGSNQSICSGTTPNSLTSVSSATGCSGTVTYQWRQSTTSSTNGFSDISGATSSTYSPPALSQTTYYVRIASCTDNGGLSSNSNVVTITVPLITSPAVGQTWNGNTVTFESNVSGGTWSVSTTPVTGVATINSSTGVLTASAAGSGTVTYTTTSPNCTITRAFNIYGTTGSLPVTWETVSAQKQNSQVLLNWSTASEQNTKDFEIQYSTNTTNWDVLGTMKAAGNSSTTRNYLFTHQAPLKNSVHNYYRILQRDLDGKFSYSKIVSIVFDEPGPDFLVYPNPADKLATIYLSEASEVSLSNSAGSVLWKSKLPAGRNQLPVEKYSAGVYYIRTSTGSQRLIIQ